MNSKTKKKVKIIAIAFIVILVPLAYYLSIVIAIDDLNREMEKCVFNNQTDSITNVALDKTRWVIFLMPWNNYARNNEINLLWKLKDYNGALHAAHENSEVNPTGMNYTVEGMAYEYLGEFEKAKPLYDKAIAIYEMEFKEKPNDDFLISEIALLSMVVGDSVRAQEVVASRIDSEDEVTNEQLKRVNHQILQHKSGGVLDFVNSKN